MSHGPAYTPVLLSAATLLGSSLACGDGNKQGTAALDRVGLHFSAVTVADGQLFAAGSYAGFSSGQLLPEGIFSTPIDIDDAGVPRPASVTSLGSGPEFVQSLIVGLGSHWLVANKRLSSSEARVWLTSLDGRDTSWEQTYEVSSLELQKLSESAFAIAVISDEPVPESYTEVYRSVEGQPERLMTLPKVCVELALAEHYAYCSGDDCDGSSCDASSPPGVMVYDTSGNEVARVTAPGELGNYIPGSPWSVNDILFVPVGGSWKASPSSTRSAASLVRVQRSTPATKRPAAQHRMALPSSICARTNAASCSP